MYIVKLIGLILLAAYLIFDGLISITGVRLGSMAFDALGLIAIGAGILLLISLAAHDHKR